MREVSEGLMLEQVTYIFTLFGGLLVTSGKVVVLSG